MTRFIQQRIKPLISRFIPKAWCPACGNEPQPVSLNIGHKKEEKVKVKPKKKKEKSVNT